MNFTLKLKRIIDLWIGGGLVLLLYPVIRFVGLILRKNHDFNQTGHITFIKMLGGGSLSMLLPSIVALKKEKPAVKLSLICTPAVKPFAELFGVFDEVKVINDKSLFKTFFSGMDVLFWLMKKGECTVDLEIHSRLTGLLSVFGLVHSRIGLINHLSLWRKRIYTHSLYVQSSAGVYKGYDAISRIFGVANATDVEVKKYLDVRLSRLNMASVSEHSIAVGPGCSDLSRERELPPQLWADYIQAFSKSYEGTYSVKPKFLFLGGKGDIRAAVDIINLCDNLICENLCGQLKLEESLAVIKNSRMYMGIDSALIHLSRLVDTPVVGFWGPTNPDHYLKKHRQLSKELHFYLKLSCSPCVHITPVPVCGGNNQCMKGLVLSAEHLNQIKGFVGSIDQQPESSHVAINNNRADQLISHPSGQIGFI